MLYSPPRKIKESFLNKSWDILITCVKVGGGDCEGEGGVPLPPRLLSHLHEQEAEQGLPLPVQVATLPLPVQVATLPLPVQVASCLCILPLPVQVASCLYSLLLPCCLPRLLYSTYILLFCVRLSIAGYLNRIHRTL